MLPVVLLTLVASPSPSAVAATSNTCRTVATEIEKREKLPEGLLYAIALTESGRWNPELKVSYAWPWTITSRSDSFVATNAADALRIVHNLQREGRGNIDVGCMQVNLFYHGDAFASVNQALDPVNNMLYAARFLKRLRRETGTWAKAIERYHSSDTERGRQYRKRVTGYWNDVRSNASVLQASFDTDASPGSLVTETLFFGKGGRSLDIVRPKSADRKSAGSKHEPAGTAIAAANQPRAGSIVALHGLDTIVETGSRPAIYRPR
ncbi:MAG: transglycosylase SLT domain-containing protein [Geminicoccaceae bacterium]|nr:transglycosylase SLT domain-containing protein [Geminicoccaceae bacterium]